MPSRSDLQFITLDDFSLGIVDDWLAAGGAASAPDGAAQLSDTWGCVSGTMGGLIPAPRRVSRMTGNQPIADFSKLPATSPRGHITSLRVVSPVMDRTSSGVAEVGTLRVHPDRVFVGFEWYANTGANYHHYGHVRAYSIFKEAAANPAAPATYDPIDKQATTGTFTGNYTFGYTSVDLSRSNNGASTDVGYPFAACTFMSNREVTSEKHVAYPSNATPTVDSVATMGGVESSGGFAAYAIMAHQDRLLVLTRSVNVGMGTDGELPTDIVGASAVNDYGTLGINVEAFVAENPGAFGSWCSVNANEAFFVKQQRGGFIVRGDVANPTIVRLPGIAPTYDAINIGTVAQNGMYIYGTRNGVYGWAGYDTSQQLSKQLNNWFWKVPDNIDGSTDGTAGVSQYLHVKGQFASLENLVYISNNYLYDLDTKSWWKLTDPNGAEPAYAFFEASASGNIIAAPASFASNTDPILDWYDNSQGQSSYSWKSQPLKKSRGRTLAFRELELVASGHGTVVVTLIGRDGATDPITFTVDDDNPVTLEQPAYCLSGDVVVKIVATATDSADPAPRVLRLGIGYMERETAR